jgi:hypothetical protein
MSRRIVVTGSREFPNLSIVCMYVLKMPKTATVITCGARGVDQAANQTARKRRMDVETYRPDWKKGRSAYFENNQVLVDAADEVVVFSYQDSEGALDIIDRARRAGLKVTVIDEQQNVIVHEAVVQTPKKAEKKKKLPKGVLEGQIEMFDQPESHVIPKSALQKAAWDEYDRQALASTASYSVQQLRNRAMRIAHEKQWTLDQAARQVSA